MSCFGCIYFSEDTILLPKVRFYPVQLLGAAGYRIEVPKLYKDMSKKDWLKLEDQLLEANVEYVVMEEQENPFTDITLVDGKEIKYYLAAALLDYIYKYKLLPKDKLYANIGIIVGQINETMDVTASILEEVTSLTFFLHDPSIYKEVICEIYSLNRLRAKAKVPCSNALKEMDVIFDLAGNYNYAKWCKPTAIYIDFKNYIARGTSKFIDPPPSIWADFNIRCGRQLHSVQVIQAAFYAQGIYKKNFLNEFKRMDISIDTVYNSRIS